MSTITTSTGAPFAPAAKGGALEWKSLKRSGESVVVRAADGSDLLRDGQPMRESGAKSFSLARSDFDAQRASISADLRAADAALSPERAAAIAAVRIWRGPLVTGAASVSAPTVEDSLRFAGIDPAGLSPEDMAAIALALAPVVTPDPEPEAPKSK